MRTIRFFVLGGVGGTFEEHGTVADLLLSIPYLLSLRIVPPLHVVNDLLRKGIRDAGMSGGCRWDVFQLTQSEWLDLVQDLKSRSTDKAYKFVQPPDWVKTIDDWNSWLMIFKHGLPEEFREIEREYKELERAREKATNEGDHSLAEQLHVRAIEAGTRLAQLVMKHCKTKER